MRQDCASALLFLLLQRKAARDGGSVVTVPGSRIQRALGRLGTLGLWQPPLTTTRAVPGL